jgi:hypothetical protein
MKPQQNPAPRHSSVFLLAFQGMEVVYDATSRQIVSRLAGVKPGAPRARDAVAAPPREKKST